MTGVVMVCSTMRRPSCRVFSQLLLWAIVCIGGEARTILGTLENDENYSTLVTLLTSVNLDQDLQCNWSRCPRYTLFAPSNEAFDAFPSELLSALGETGVRNLLMNHMVEGSLYSSQLLYNRDKK